MVFRVIAYVDGFNLYYGMKSKGLERYLWLDLQQLVKNLIRTDQQLVQTKYFTARVSGTPTDPDKPKRQGAYLEALGTLPDFEVYYGHYLEKQIMCFKCGAVWKTKEEKMTDVNIAVEILKDAYRNRFDTALVISGDSDLAGPIREVRALFPGKWVVVAFPPGRHSERLRKEANYAFTIGRANLASSQFPIAVTKKDGFVLNRPDTWK